MHILTLIHNHQSFSVGGAENAAFALHNEFCSIDGINAYLLAAVPNSKKILEHGEIRCINSASNEYIIGSTSEWVPFINSDPSKLRAALKQLLAIVQPDIIHIQHYLSFGIDIIIHLRELSPRSVIAVTLHEYFPLCLNHGQMIKVNSAKLCDLNDPLSCKLCFPEFDESLFVGRNFIFRQVLESADVLISPSSFLVSRYVQCGFNSALFRVIENGLPRAITSINRKTEFGSHSAGLNRFAFFGQLNPYKGIDLLLKAAQLLISDGGLEFTLTIHGANLEFMPDDFQDLIQELLQQCKSHVTLMGSYAQSEIVELMQETDWVIVPSKWWENSPVVIQEAFYCCRPIIGCDIGGTKEKIENQGGLLFKNNSFSSLARAMRTCIGNDKLYTNLRNSIPPPFLSQQCAELHIELFNSLLN